MHRWKFSLKIFHSTSIHYRGKCCAKCWSPRSECPFIFITTMLHWHFQIHPPGAWSVTFLLHLGWLVNLPFGIPSMTNIVAFEIFSSNFLDAQNLRSCFIFYFSLTYTRNREKKIRMLLRLKGHRLCVTQSSNQRAHRWGQIEWW